VLTALIDGGFRGELRRVTSLDTFVPLGDAANRVLVQEPAIVREALALVGRS
jgi:2-oxoisovalerate dehydrogenase E1 component